MADCSIIDINSEIKKCVIELRKSRKIKLPDAIIAATAMSLNIPFMSADKQLKKFGEKISYFMINRKLISGQLRKMSFSAADNS